MAERTHSRRVTFDHWGRLVGFITPEEPTLEEKQQLVRWGFKIVHHGEPWAFYIPKKTKKEIF